MQARVSRRAFLCALGVCPTLGGGCYLASRLNSSTVGASDLFCGAEHVDVLVYVDVYEETWRSKTYLVVKDLYLQRFASDCFSDGRCEVDVVGPVGKLGDTVSTHAFYGRHEFSGALLRFDADGALERLIKDGDLLRRSALEFSAEPRWRPLRAGSARIETRCPMILQDLNERLVVEADGASLGAVWWASTGIAVADEWLLAVFRRGAERGGVEFDAALDCVVGYNRSPSGVAGIFFMRPDPSAHDFVILMPNASDWKSTLVYPFSTDGTVGFLCLSRDGILVVGSDGQIHYRLDIGHGSELTALVTKYVYGPGRPRLRAATFTFWWNTGYDLAQQLHVLEFDARTYTCRRRLLRCGEGFKLSSGRYRARGPIAVE